MLGTTLPTEGRSFPNAQEGLIATPSRFSLLPK
jgi:hypothetical protein